jgi:hypothetical protein
MSKVGAREHVKLLENLLQVKLSFLQVVCQIKSELIHLIIIYLYTT